MEIRGRKIVVKRIIVSNFINFRNKFNFCFLLCAYTYILKLSFYYFEVHLILVYYVVFIFINLFMFWFLTEHGPVSLFVLVIEFFFLSILK